MFVLFFKQNNLDLFVTILGGKFISRGKFQKTIARYKWSCTAIVIFEWNILNKIYWIEIRIWLITFNKIFVLFFKQNLSICYYFWGNLFQLEFYTKITHQNLWLYFSICIGSSLFLDHIMTAIISKDIIKQILTDLGNRSVGMFLPEGQIVWSIPWLNQSIFTLLYPWIWWSCSPTIAADHYILGYDGLPQ